MGPTPPPEIEAGTPASAPDESPPASSPPASPSRAAVRLSLARPDGRRQLRRAEALRLGSVGIDDRLGAELAAVLAWSPPNEALQRLDLSGNQLGDRACRAIANALGKLPALVALGLEGNALSDEAGTVLARALSESAAQLRVLMLGWNRLQARSGVALALALDGLPELRLLGVGGSAPSFYAPFEACVMLMHPLPASGAHVERRERGVRVPLAEVARWLHGAIAAGADARASTEPPRTASAVAQALCAAEAGAVPELAARAVATAAQLLPERFASWCVHVAVACERLGAERLFDRAAADGCRTASRLVQLALTGAAEVHTDALSGFGVLAHATDGGCKLVVASARAQAALDVILGLGADLDSGGAKGRSLLLAILRVADAAAERLKRGARAAHACARIPEAAVRVPLGAALAVVTLACSVPAVVLELLLIALLPPLEREVRRKDLVFNWPFVRLYFNSAIGALMIALLVSAEPPRAPPPAPPPASTPWLAPHAPPAPPPSPSPGFEESVTESSLIPLCLFVLGFAQVEAEALLREGLLARPVRALRAYLRDEFNLFDLVGLLAALAWLGLVLARAAGARHGAPHTWEVSVRALAVLALCASHLRIGYMVPALGPFLLMSLKMFKDVGRLVVLMVPISLAFAIALHALYKRAHGSDEAGGCSTAGEPGAQGELERSFEEGVGSALVLLLEVTFAGREPPMECVRESGGAWGAWLLMLSYLVVTVLLLLNVIIAAMAKTFDTVHDEIDVNAKFVKAKLVIAAARMSVVFPPLNLLGLPSRLLLHCWPSLRARLQVGAPAAPAAEEEAEAEAEAAAAEDDARTGAEYSALGDAMLLPAQSKPAAALGAGEMGATQSTTDAGAAEREAPPGAGPPAPSAGRRDGASGGAQLDEWVLESARGYIAEHLPEADMEDRWRRTAAVRQVQMAERLARVEQQQAELLELVRELAPAAASKARVERRLRLAGAGGSARGIGLAAARAPLSRAGSVRAASAAAAPAGSSADAAQA